MGRAAQAEQAKALNIYEQEIGPAWSDLKGQALSSRRRCFQSRFGTGFWRGA